MSEIANSIRQMRDLAKAWKIGAPHQQPMGAHLDAVCDEAEAPLMVISPDGDITLANEAAREKAEEIVATAKAEAALIEGEAETRAGDILAEAELKAEELIKSATAEAERIQADAATAPSPEAAGSEKSNDEGASS